MELREYLSVRRAYNLVRQDEPSEMRLTFEEFSILCRLDMVNMAVKTSDIADYQGALRPTMTHRTNHLARLGLIERGEGERDRRNVVCAISEEGRAHVDSLCRKLCDDIPNGYALARTSPERIRRYIDAMGSVYVKAGDLVLIGLLGSENGSASITSLVDTLGLLQPTVSMSVSSLVESGLVKRGGAGDGARTLSLRLTDSGVRVAEEIVERISAVVVHRRPRAKATE